MSLSSTAVLQSAGNLLQAPARLAGIARYWLLLAAVGLGWRIDGPVYLRPRWGERGPRLYHFVLSRSPYSPTPLLAVPEGPEVERYLSAAGLELSVS